jgi:hypothetical protein
VLDVDHQLRPLRFGSTLSVLDIALEAHAKPVAKARASSSVTAGMAPSRRRV